MKALFIPVIAAILFSGCATQPQTMSVASPSVAKPDELASAAESASLKDLLEQKRLVLTPMQGGRGGRVFFDCSTDKNVFLVGFDIRAGNLLDGLTPVYANPNGPESRSHHFGGMGGSEASVVAKPGYAVGGIRVKAGRFVDGLTVVFMKVKDGKLDPADKYECENWLGGRGGGEVTSIESDGRAVVGIHGRHGTVIDGIGLIFRQN